jgi:3-phenylpropionate/trans-cinnamate dioxygenase ferredoxin subunit
MPFVRAASLGELPEGTALGVEVEGKAVCLVMCEGEIYAFQDNCSHRDFLLSHGELDVEACAITCEWHGAQFDVRTGQVLCPPATKPIAVYSCRVEGDAILVEIESV